ncbi:right-handed parallel beta-helix repeat-containing protein [bacterium]|nr:right-handed parallel beta-helix repeat-containing protein [bacterium]
MTKSLLILLLCLNPAFAAQTWHVAGTGNDSADGTSADTAFRTLSKAATQVQPGDTVLIGDGIYTADNAGKGSSVLNLSQQGKPDAWTTWKAAPGTRPEIRPGGWHGIVVSGSYLIIDGLRVTGANDSITLIDALKNGQPGEKDGNLPRADPRFNTNGISIDGRNNPPDRKPHHIIVRNCVVSKCPGGGISMLETDYITLEDNQVFENAWYMRYAGSGITALNNWAYDAAPGYHFIIQRNRVWNNKTLVPWAATGKLSDGNGILLDVTDGVADGKPGENATNPNADAAVKPKGVKKADPNAASLNPLRPQWQGRTLIANNLSAFNGGSGIHTFRTRHVDIINNTTYWNGGIVGYQELFANRSQDVVILNNVIVPRPGGKVTSSNSNKDIRWDYNLYPAGQEVYRGANDIVAEPRFISLNPDLREADFRLAPGSPAIDSGGDELPQASDIAGKTRPSGKSRDRGAYEQ